MNLLLPFGLSGPSAFYLLMYWLTFVLHQAFMHYVLAGSLVVAWAACFPGNLSRRRVDESISATLRDWMPFLLSAAITAGVAPLLFIQIVYQHPFYAANLLLWWRWMIVVPVLIVAFYLLYLLKSDWFWRLPRAVTSSVSLLTSGSFVFVGFCWTVNHLLANRPASWPNTYATGHLPVTAFEVISRLAVWIGGSFSTMCVILGWQLYSSSAVVASTVEDPVVEDTVNARRLTVLSLGGLIAASLASLIYLFQIDLATRHALLSPSMIVPWIGVTAGLALQGIGWGIQWKQQSFKFNGLLAATIGAVTTLCSISLIREAIRIKALDIRQFEKLHAAAANEGGFLVFLIAAVLVGAVIVWCIQLVSTGLRNSNVDDQAAVVPNHSND